MKLIRFGEPNKEKPGVLLNGLVRLDVSSFIPDFNEDFFADGAWLACGNGSRVTQPVLHG
jgi:hypothetical protein